MMTPKNQTFGSYALMRSDSCFVLRVHSIAKVGGQLQLYGVLGVRAVFGVTRYCISTTFSDSEAQLQLLTVKSASYLLLLS